jgi:SAM-dependent methyltransferase
MKNPTTNPTMYDDFVELDGIRLRVDRLDRERTDNDDNVMAIFYEEQPFTWQFVQPYLRDALTESAGEIDFLDVGCGSGIFSLLMAKHYNAKVIAIDKSNRAIDFAGKNAILNDLEFQIQHELYNVCSAPKEGSKIIGLYPPYHIYPEFIKEKIPQHARGGSNGQEEFKNQLAIASNHLAENGIIFFNQMCLGDESGPDLLDYIPKLVVDNPSVIYTNVLPPIETKEFLEGVYRGDHRYFVDKVSSENPWVHYTVGIVKRDRKGEVIHVKHDIDLKGRSWEDRIKLHREIALHEFR